MDNSSMNRYEKQLYTVFKTFDVDNEEALDKLAVHQLCDALQLEDRGAALADTLFERRADRVTFAQFRNGLLAVLGGAGGEAPVAATAGADPLVLHSDEDSSGREVAPKFVFGSKKYGRRSRPVRAPAADESTSPRSSSASRLDSDDRRARQRPRCRRSTSAMESRDESAREDCPDAVAVTGAFEHDRRIDRDEALALCRGLSMDRIDRRLVERIFEDTGSADTTVGEFFDRLNSSLTTTMEEAAQVAGASASPRNDDGHGESSTGVAADLVLDAWERAGVRRPRRLLAELGFAAPALRPPDLERALDDELRALPESFDDREDARALLLVAALALNRLRLELARHRADAAAAERDKLRFDVVEANRRAGLLAQEVDESHARLETELRSSLRRAEARHADAARQAAEETAAERERAAAERAGLEAELARRADSEARSRSDTAAVRARVVELEGRALAAEGRLAEAERERARLAGELRSAQARGAATEAGGGAASALAARFEELRRENELLRDRNDELCAELEARPRGLPPLDRADVPPRGHLSAELDSLLTHDRSEDCDSSPVSTDRRILGHVEAVAILREVFESVDAIPGIDKDCRVCGRVAEGVQATREKVRELSESLMSSPHATADATAQTDAPAEATADTDTSALRGRLADVELRHEEDKGKLTSLVKDLEISLDQMKAEYDKCEEYWAGKLEEEREAYAEEQRLGDERLGDLVSKIGEYERRFAASAALPTIDERHSLEAQFTDLEEEFARYRAEREAELAARAAEAARLAERVRALEAAADARRRPRDYHNPAYTDAPPDSAARAGCEAGARAAAELRELRELRARTARAEAGARRLHARLAAADLLVKELYVENCQLAQRRPL